MTIHVPARLYERLARRAQQTRRSMELELVEAAMAGLPDESHELPAALADAIAPLALLDDEALWDAARSHLSLETMAMIEGLHLQRQARGLTSSETETLSALVQQYERAMLVRAEAAALLKQRGHDVSGLLVSV